MKRLAIVVLMLTCALTMSGCGGPSAAEQKAKCFENEAIMRTEMKLFTADSGLEAPFSTVVAKTQSVCPSGGRYSWDAATGVVTCSIHGHP